MSPATPRRLVIVESPTKARTIRRFLPDAYRVEASMGHVRDLPASASEIPEAFRNADWARIGVNVDDDFTPLYVVSGRSRTVVRELKQALRDADELYIATDEDREGESIGWHLVEVLEPDVPVRRMVFHEITEDAIVRALDETRDIDSNLVDAQETRRVLDRLVGYTISPVLWRKIAPRLSAGRVQSVAVRLLVLRERDRMRFTPASYWDLKAALAKTEGDTRAFDATMTHLGGIRLASGRDFDADTGQLEEGTTPGEDVVLLGAERAAALTESVAGAAWSVASIESREATRNPAPPFTTSTLQQESSRKLSLSAKDTMRVAQRLYENGYITYMRTDSTNLSSEAIGAARSAITRRYGEDYLFERVRQYTKKSRNAQEAHEAVRPAGTEMKTAAEHKLSGKEAALYDLIWKRTVATQMAEARLKFVTARIEVETSEGTATFRASGRTVLFPGFFRAYVEGSDDPDAALDDRDQPLPELDEGDALEAQRVEPVGHETKPPSRYTEASLVKMLEQEGIGRPSTYASIIDTIHQRGYVRKNGSQLVPTFTAFATTNLLEREFRPLVDTEFTARMEASLDDIASGDLAATPYLRDFYRGDDGIENRVEHAIDAVDPREISTVDNPKWDPYTVRVGRYGPYVEATVDGQRVTTSVPDETAPADLTREDLEELIRLASRDDEQLGEDPATGMAMYLKTGPYGPYLQLGPDDQEGRPKRVSVPKGVDPGEVDAELAADLLALPRELGTHPESNDPVVAGIGRYGPYVKHQRTYASLKDEDDVLEVDLPRALELLAQKRQKRGVLRVVGDHPETGDPIELRDGRYGPYVKHGKTNASLKRDQDPDDLTLDDAVALIREREAKSGKRGGSKRKSKGKSKSKSKRKSKPKRPKATPADLEPFLEELDDDVREVVVRLEGMKGSDKQEVVEVADALGLAEEDVEAKRKRGMFKLRMAFGKARQSDA